MDNIFLQALQHPFFVRSLIIVVLLGIVFPLYGNIVIVRKEANIAHTFAHIGLLGVAIGLWFDRSIELSILCSTILTIILLYMLGTKETNNQVSHNEIGAQLGLVGAILIVSQMTGYKADISTYLFGDILLLGQKDVYIMLLIASICLVSYYIWGKKRYAISLHKSLATSKNISTTSSYLLYLLALGLLIAGAMKIIGVLLVSAFLVLPSNIGKQLATSKQQRNYLSIITCCLLSIAGLLLSWHLDIPSGASIIALMIFCFLLCNLAKVFYKG